jgi:hypothetical protein
VCGAVSKRALEKIRRLIQSRDWIAGCHVQNYLDDGEFDENDIEVSICNGTITRVQRDELGEAIDGKKYIITGLDKYGLALETCGKIIEWTDGHQYFLITAYKVT